MRLHDECGGSWWNWTGLLRVRDAVYIDADILLSAEHEFNATIYGDFVTCLPANVSDSELTGDGPVVSKPMTQRTVSAHAKPTAMLMGVSQCPTFSIGCSSLCH